MNNLKRIYQQSRESFLHFQKNSIENRLKLLTHLEEEIRNFEPEIYEALKHDLNKSKTETLLTELSVVYHEIQYFKRHVSKLSRSKFKLPSLSQFPGYLKIFKEPYGVVLVISPWNYPFQLALLPTIGAIAAGNTVLLKPSTKSKETFRVIEKIIKKCCPKNEIQVISSIRNPSFDLLSMPIDYLFFTGSTATAKNLYQQAASQLIPVTLELGGKSPCIVDRTADLNMTAKKIVFGKLINAGQTCIAPDFVLVDSQIKKDLVEKINIEIENALPNESYVHSFYGKIITTTQFEKIKSNFLDQKEYLKYFDEQNLQIKPFVIENASFNDPFMKNEIFAPILPIISYQNTAELSEDLDRIEKPLAYYIFSKDASFIKRCLSLKQSGGVCVNDCLLHIASTNAPFGGVGQSGIGQYHGKYSFDTFTHKRTVLYKSMLFDFKQRYMPYSKKTYQFFKKLLS